MMAKYADSEAMGGGRRKDIAFYSVVPLFERELKYKFAHGVDALLDLFDQIQGERQD